jgi:hypothetical protein
MRHRAPWPSTIIARGAFLGTHVLLRRLRKQVYGGTSQTGTRSWIMVFKQCCSRVVRCTHSFIVGAGDIPSWRHRECAGCAQVTTQHLFLLVGCRSINSFEVLPESAQSCNDSTARMHSPVIPCSHTVRAVRCSKHQPATLQFQSNAWAHSILLGACTRRACIALWDGVQTVWQCFRF